MRIYIDIDGVLLDYHSGTYAKGAVELIEYVTREFDCYWLTTHCKGDSAPAVNYLSEYFPPEVIRQIQKIKPTYWEDLKTEGIDFDSNFIWLDDYPFQAEMDVLNNFGVSDSLLKVNLNNEGELLRILEHLKEIKAKRRRRIRRAMYVIIGFIISLIVAKAIWMGTANRSIGDFGSEKDDILKRRAYLIEKVITEPKILLAQMPEAVGPQFQGEWALYSASMLSAALSNIAIIYPETRADAEQRIDTLIQIVISPELRRYDAHRWGEDPLETLDGDVSHISYLSHLAWMISGYKQTGGDGKYDELYRDICATMNRRILMSPNLNLQTYPGELVYVPDMLVAIVALANYSKQNKGEYWSTVHAWLQEMQTNWIDEKTGLIMSMLPDSGIGAADLPAKGSYSALSCYYLTFIDEDIARGQYQRLKENFLQHRPIAGFKEYHDRRCWLGFDIDAGPILLNLSPTGTAFGIGPATFFQDREVRCSFLRTAELAGFSVSTEEKRHYLLADIALVGEAITLAMRTAVKWN